MEQERTIPREPSWSKGQQVYIFFAVSAIAAAVALSKNFDSCRLSTGANQVTYSLFLAMLVVLFPRSDSRGEAGAGSEPRMVVSPRTLAGSGSRVVSAAAGTLVMAASPGTRVAMEISVGAE